MIPAAGKVTVGLPFHWPCVTDFSALPTYGLNLMAYEQEMSTRLHSFKEYGTVLPF